MKYSIYTFIYFLLMATSAYPQAVMKNKISYILQGGAATYTGELSPNFQTFTYKPTAGLGIAYRINPFLSGRMDMNFFKLGGGNSILVHSLSFSSNNAELSANLVFDLIPQKRSFKYRSDLIPYLFAGAGLNAFKTSVFQDGDSKNFTVDQNSGMRIVPVIPLGVGFKFKGGTHTDIYIECGYRKTFTGSLDNINVVSSTTGQINAASDSPVNTQPLVKTSHTDGYFLTTFKVVYTPDYLLRKKVRSATPQSKSASRYNKRTWRQISKNKKLASDKVRVAYNQ